MTTTFLVPKNNANGRLNAAITAVATTLTLQSGEGARFPSTYPFHITIDNEILKCTNRSTDTLTVVRAQESTTGAAHSAGATVALNITAQHISDLNSAVSAMESLAHAKFKVGGAYFDELEFSEGAGIELMASVSPPMNPTKYTLGIAVADPVTDKSCQVYHNVNQAIPTSSMTAVAFNTELVDTDTMHNTVTNNSRITFTTAGKYLFGATISWGATTSGRRILLVRINGGKYIANNDGVVSGIHHQVGGLYNFSAGDYIELIAWQNSGGDLDIQSNLIDYCTPHFWATKIP